MTRGNLRPAGARASKARSGAGQRREGSVLGGALPTAQSVKEYLSGSPAFGRAFSYNPQPGTVEVVADPHVDGTYAAQFTDVEDREPRTVHLLFVTGHEQGTVEEVLEATLEEVEYECWPPTSGSLRFF